MNLTA